MALSEHWQLFFIRFERPIRPQQAEQNDPPPNPQVGVSTAPDRKGTCAVLRPIWSVFVGCELQNRTAKDRSATSRMRGSGQKSNSQSKSDNPCKSGARCAFARMLIRGPMLDDDQSKWNVTKMEFPISSALLVTFASGFAFGDFGGNRTIIPILARGFLVVLCCCLCMELLMRRRHSSTIQHCPSVLSGQSLVVERPLQMGFPLVGRHYGQRKRSRQREREKWKWKEIFQRPCQIELVRAETWAAFGLGLHLGSARCTTRAGLCLRR